MPEHHPRMDAAFLASVCSRPWQDMTLGGLEKADLYGSARANHIHVGCEMPFVIAATSATAPHGDEHFGLCVITDPRKISAFVCGPYPPHNFPPQAPLGEVVGLDLTNFLPSPKSFGLLRRPFAVPGLEGVIMGGPVYGVEFEGGGIKVVVHADEAVPMAIRVGSAQASSS